MATVRPSAINTVVTAVALGAALASCGADTVDFTRTAEDTARAAIEAAVPGSATVRCDSPDDPRVGAVFACAGTASDGTTFRFEAEITGADEVTVTPLVTSPVVPDATASTPPVAITLPSEEADASSPGTSVGG